MEHMITDLASGVPKTIHVCGFARVYVLVHTIGKKREKKLRSLLHYDMLIEDLCHEILGKNLNLMPSWSQIQSNPNPTFFFTNIHIFVLLTMVIKFYLNAST